MTGSSWSGTQEVRYCPLFIVALAVADMSSGGWKACYLAKIIQAMGGLPKNGDAELYHGLYQRTSKYRLITPEDVAELIKGYQGLFPSSTSHRVSSDGAQSTPMLQSKPYAFLIQSAAWASPRLVSLCPSL